MPLGAVAEGPLQHAWGCCCCPGGCGQGWQGAGVRVWSPRCSPQGLPRPHPAPEPPGGPARRPRAGGECAPSPRRGSQRLGTGAGVRVGETGPHPLKSAPPAQGLAGHWLCVTSKASFISALCTQTPAQVPSEDRMKPCPFTPSLSKKDLHHQLLNCLPDSTFPVILYNPRAPAQLSLCGPASLS